MCPLIVFHLIALSLVQSAPTCLRHGALVAPQGRVSLIEDYAWIEYPLETLREVPEQLKNILEKLEDSTNHLESGKLYGMASPSETVLLRGRIQHLQLLLQDAILDYSTNPVLVQPNSRQKRGFIDGIGLLSRSIFGTAMDSDVKSLQAHYTSLLSSVRSVTDVVNLHSQRINALQLQLQRLTDFTNAFVKAVKNIYFAAIKQLQIFTTIDSTLNSLETATNSFLYSNQLVINNLVDAARGRVTASLFPLRDLRRVISDFTNVTSNSTLYPIFNGKDIIHYYPLLTSMLTTDSIVIHVPFQSGVSYNLYHLAPFPFKLNNTVLQWSNPSSYVLTPDDFSSYTVTSISAFRACRSEHLALYFCPASLFAFAPDKIHGICELALIRDEQRALSLCKYTELAPLPFYHNRFLDHHYFFMPNVTHVTIQCGNSREYSRVEGHFSVPLRCSVSSARVSTFPTKYHRGFRSSLAQRIYFLNLNFSSSGNLSFFQKVPRPLSQLTLLNSSAPSLQPMPTIPSLPTALHPHHYFISLGCIASFLIIILIIACCILKRFLNSTRLLRQGQDTAV